ncbi:MAG: hypothetical protein R2856_34660 [Caldilineaceae bacterium]
MAVAGRARLRLLVAKGSGRAEWIVSVACEQRFLFNASSSMWWGGFAVGPRYLLPMLPWMTLAAAFAVEMWLRSRWSAVALIALLAWAWAATWAVTLAGQAFPRHHPQYVDGLRAAKLANR